VHFHVVATTAATRDLRLEDVTQFSADAHAAYERLQLLTAQSLDISTARGSFEADEELDLDSGEVEASAAGGGEKAAKAVSALFLEAQAALATAQSAKDAYLLTKEEGEFMARREAKTARDVVLEAEKALNAIKRSAAVVGKKSALGASSSSSSSSSFGGKNRHNNNSGNLDGTVAATRNKGTLLWTELSELAHNLVSVCVWFSSYTSVSTLFSTYTDLQLARTFPLWNDSFFTCILLDILHVCRSSYETTPKMRS
jgi:hypothetical protein